MKKNDQKEIEYDHLVENKSNQIFKEIWEVCRPSQLQEIQSLIKQITKGAYSGVI